jgi:hypothetical protein
MWICVPQGKHEMRTNAFLLDLVEALAPISAAAWQIVIAVATAWLIQRGSPFPQKLG